MTDTPAPRTLAAVLAEHRRQVLAEAADAIATLLDRYHQDLTLDTPADTAAYRAGRQAVTDAAALVRRLAAAAPETAPRPRQDDETAPAVGREAAQAQRATETAAPDGPRTWQLPDEPGPEVRRLRPVERYPGDNSIWLDREPDNTGWRIVIRGRSGEPMEWVRAYSLGAGTVWGGRPLVDATPADGGGCE